MSVSVSQLSPGASGLLNSPAKNGIAKPTSLSLDGGLDFRPGSVHPDLGIIEAEQLVRDQVRLKYRELLQAFQTCDGDKTHSVTKSDFQRVLELFCVLSPTQMSSILSKVDSNRNGTIKYRDFLNKFYSATPARRHSSLGIASGPRTARPMPRLLTPIPQCDTEDYDEMEKALREKAAQNIQPILKALRLFDYVGDRKVQRHELQKVLENYCFKLTNKQLSRLWQRMECGNTIDYHEFFRKLGVVLDNTTGGAPQKEKKSGVRPGVNTGGNLERLTVNMYELEHEFRRKMRENYTLLIRAFLSFDATRDGFVTIAQLRAILNQFVVPMSEEVFEDLMERLQVKATGKLAWMSFVERFQDPLATSDGAALPIKSRVKWNPHRGVGHSASLKDVISLMNNHVNFNFHSLRTAFLGIDKNRSGKITRSELRKVLAKFKIVVSDQQLRELASVLDTDGSGTISYHAFLDMFEPRETKEGHKWLKSMHRYNDQDKPAIIAWATIEDLMNQHLTANWKDLSSALQKADPKGTGYLSAKALKKIVDVYGMRTSKEHFENLMSRVARKNESGHVCYLDFLTLLKVEGSPGDVTGVSQTITDNNTAANEVRDHDHKTKMESLANNAQQRTESMSVDELVVRLRDRMAQHNTQIRETFLSFDPDRKGFIRRSDFKKIVASYGLVMADEQFAALAAKLGMESRKDVMDYRQFVRHFEDTRRRADGETETEGSLLPLSNHHVNRGRGDEYGMTAEAVEAKLREKLRQNFSRLREAFHKFDDENRGALTKDNFRRLLDSTMCVLNEEEFEKLCARLEIGNNSKITYLDFLKRFEVTDSLTEGHKWLVSMHRYNEQNPLQQLSAEEVHKILAEKVHQHYQDVARAFCHTDNRGRGVITRKEFKILLSRFNITMNVEEFRKLWKFYDASGRGVIAHDDFLRRVGIGGQFTSGDQGGTSEKIIQNSHTAVSNILEKQRLMHEQMTQFQAQLGVHLTVEQLHAALRVRIRDDFKDTFSAMKRYDEGGKGYLTYQDLQNMLSDLHLIIDDEQFEELMNLIGIDSTSSHLSYEQFCAAFDEELRGPEMGTVPCAHHIRFADDNGASAQEVENRLRDHVTRNFDNLRKAFLAFDEDRKGDIPTADFKRILDNFCLKTSVSNFKNILSKCTVKENGRVDYVAFLTTFNLTAEEEAHQWMMQQRQPTTSTAAAAGKPASPELPLKALSPVEMADRVLEVVRARPDQLRSDLEAADFARIGVVAKADFREILHRHVMRVSDEQYEAMWCLLPVNQFGNINYRELFAEADRAQQKVEAAAAAAAEAERVKLEAERAAEMARPLEDRLVDVARKHWRPLFAACKESDDGSGEIGITDFAKILSSFGLDARPRDLAPLLRRYGLHGESGLFRYQDLMRGYVLNTPQVEAVNVVKEKLHKAKIPLQSRGESSRDLFACMRQIRGRILADWKDLRRQFRAVDVNNSGKVSTGQFRTTLAKFGLQLGEDEFYDLMTHFDKGLGGSINYSDFIKAFLASA